MAVDQENISKILSVLSHHLRREILLYLTERDECSFTDLINLLNVDTGKLSFHIRSLSAFIEQAPSGKYRLTKVGKNAVVLIKDLEAWSSETKVADKTSTLPLAKTQRRIFAFLIDFAISFTLFMALPTVPSSLLSGTAFFLNFNILLFLLLFWIYMTLLEGFAGQSLGKRIMKLKVVRIDGKNLSYDYSAVRNFGKVFLLPLDLFFGYRLKDTRFLKYFDKFTGTTVVDIRPQSSES